MDVSQRYQFLIISHFSIFEVIHISIFTSVSNNVCLEHNLHIWIKYYYTWININTNRKNAMLKFLSILWIGCISYLLVLAKSFHRVTKYKTWQNKLRWINKEEGFFYTYFDLIRIMNKYNFCYWSDSNPHDIYQRLFYCFHVTFWYAVSVLVFETCTLFYRIWCDRHVNMALDWYFETWQNFFWPRFR